MRKQHLCPWRGQESWRSWGVKEAGTVERPCTPKPEPSVVLFVNTRTSGCYLRPLLRTAGSSSEAATQDHPVCNHVLVSHICQHSCFMFQFSLLLCDRGQIPGHLISWIAFPTSRMVCTIILKAKVISKSSALKLQSPPKLGLREF